MKPTLRAIISDQKLHGSKMATVYGSSSDNDTIRIFKQVGYGISIFFLLLTLAIYFVIKEVRTVSFHLKNEVKVQNCKKCLCCLPTKYSVWTAAVECMTILHFVNIQKIPLPLGPGKIRISRKSH